MCQVWYFMFGIHLINMFIMLLSYFNSPLFWLMLKWTFIIFLLFIREVQIITINVVKEELKLLIDKFADQHHICIKIAKFSISSGWKNWNSSHSTHSKKWYLPQLYNLQNPKITKNIKFSHCKYLRSKLNFILWE